MTIYKLTDQSAADFCEKEEAFPSIHYGKVEGRDCIVVDCQIAVVVDENLQDDLFLFCETVWPADEHSPRRELVLKDVRARYEKWFEKLDELNMTAKVEVEAPSQTDPLAKIFGVVSPVPSRPGLTPAPAHLRGGLPSVHGHLPFYTTARPMEKFYRFEAWPTSRRLSGTKIQPGTFASPESELTFLPTGFAAVARNALPSFFPACFKYDLTPRPVSTDPAIPMLCGAVVPMYGQSGGGVEVMFPSTVTTANIAGPVPIPPL